MTWVWSESRSRKNARLLLLAIADCASDDGANAYPSIAELKRKTGMSERAVQSTLGDLVTLGELVVHRNAGPGGCNRYLVVMTPADSAPPQDLHPPAGSAGVRDLHPPTSVGMSDLPPQDLHPAESAPPQKTTKTPAESAPGTVLEPSKKNSSTKSSSKPAKKRADPDEETVGQRVNRLARIYTDQVPLSNFNAVAGVVRKAATVGVSDDLITHGLTQLAADQRAVTVDALRYAIYGVPPRAANAGAAGTTTRPSTTDQRVAAGLALAAQLDANPDMLQLEGR